MIVRLLYRLFLQTLRHGKNEFADGNAVTSVHLPTEHSNKATASAAAQSTRSLKVALTVIVLFSLVVVGWRYLDSASKRFLDHFGGVGIASLHLHIPTSSHWPVVVYLQGDAGYETLADTPYLTMENQLTKRPTELSRTGQPTLSTITSINSNFHPNFQMVPTGTPLVIKNDDPVAHNTHIFNRGVTVFNVALPTKEKVVTKSLSGTGMFSVRCDLHPTMQAWIFSPPSPHFAIVEKSEWVRLDKIPAGNHVLHLWSPKITEQLRLIELRSDEEKVLYLK